MVPSWVAILTALTTLVGGSAGASFVTRWWERRREPALLARLTTEAAATTHREYEKLVEQHRADASLARQMAHDATVRAVQAETRAQAAELRAARLEIQLAELCALVRRHIPHMGEEWDRLFSPNGWVLEAPAPLKEEERKR